MGLLKNLIEKIKNKKSSENAEEEEARTYERQQKMIRKYEMKQLSADERELMRIAKEEREKIIHKQLEGYRKQKQQEYIHGKINRGNFIVRDDPNLFKNNNIFTNKSRRINK